jgi:hypothetical protein
MALALPLWYLQNAMEFLPNGWVARDLLNALNVNMIGAVLARETGPTIVAIWVATALAGRRRADPGWVDRVGRVLGWSWVAVWLVNVSFVYYVWLSNSKK